MAGRQMAQPTQTMIDGTSPRKDTNHDWYNGANDRRCWETTAAIVSASPL
jgi:hypothetical protein